MGATRWGSTGRAWVLAACIALAVTTVGVVLAPAAPAGATVPTTVVPIAAGNRHSCAVTSGGGVRCWGRNTNGQLGNGTTTQSTVPVAVSTLTSGVKAVTAGFFHSCAVTTGGAAKCWGYNIAGQLGIGSNTQSTVPAGVTGLSSGVAEVVAGNLHTCALTTGGAVWCWGSNTNGQLGNATTTASTVPVAVTGLSSGVVAVSAGDTHSCAVLAAGTVSCWGSNGSGELGTGTTTQSTTPVAVAGLAAGIVQATAGDRHTCALTSAGAVHCWGRNSNGQLGNGTTTASLSPVAVTSLGSGVAALRTGTTNSCALTTAGAVRCWGFNTNGELGNGTTTQSTVPVSVVGLTEPAIALSTGNDHSCVLGASGAARCWGFNGTGGLGDGTTTGSSTTVAVSGGATFYAPLSITGSRAPAPNAAGWNDSPVTVTFSCAGGIAPLECPPATTLGEGADQSVTGTATDAVPWSETTTVSGIDVDLTAPTLTGTATTDPNAGGWYRSDVIVDWSCSDALSGIAGACPADATVTGEGAALTAVATVADVAGNATTAPSAPVSIDRTAPVTSVAATPAWSNTAVTLALTPTDGLSGVASTWSSIDGATAVEGLAPQVTGDGTHTVTFGSIDVAGNGEDPSTVSVAIDGTPPTIVGSASPKPNEQGWNRDDVVVSWLCGDGVGSGVATCSAPDTVTTEGPGQDVTGEVVDVAGNVAVGHVSVSIDRTAPTIAAVLPPVPPSGWFTGPVPLSWACSDPGGALASGVASCPDATTITGDGAHRTASGTVRDTAGNEATAGADVAIDTVAPTISGAPTTAPNGAGWHAAAVTVHWTCADATSGVVACPADEVVSTQGTTTLARTVFDAAGNTSAPGQVTINIDAGGSTTITSTVMPAPNDAGWSRTPVTVHFTCAAVSGVASCTPDELLASEGADQPVIGTVVDNADNTASTTVEVDIDLTAPTVAVTGVTDGASYTAGAVPDVACTTTDALSGVAVAAVLDVSGGPPTGPGDHTATCAGAVDNAGNTGGATVTYTVTASSGTVTGVVSSTAGGPVEGAVVRLYTSRHLDSAVAAATTTDAAGRYLLADVSPATYYLYAGKSGASYSAWAADPVVITPGGETTVGIAIRPGVAGGATVLGPTGPVAGATVRVMVGGNPTAKRVLTDAAGHYVLTGVVAGTYTVSVTAFGFAPATSAPFTVTSGSSAVPSPDVELTAAPSTAGIGGVARNALTNAPLGGTNVRLWLVGSASTNAVRSTTTATDGSWAMATVPGGTYNVQFAHPGAAASGYFATSVTLVVNPNRAVLTTTVDPSTGRVEGTLLQP